MNLDIFDGDYYIDDLIAVITSKPARVIFHIPSRQWFEWNGEKYIPIDDDPPEIMELSHTGYYVDEYDGLGVA